MNEMHKTIDRIFEWFIKYKDTTNKCLEKLEIQKAADFENYDKILINEFGGRSEHNENIIESLAESKLIPDKPAIMEFEIVNKLSKSEKKVSSRFRTSPKRCFTTEDHFKSFLNLTDHRQSSDVQASTRENEIRIKIEAINKSHCPKPFNFNERNDRYIYPPDCSKIKSMKDLNKLNISTFEDNAQMTIPNEENACARESRNSNYETIEHELNVKVRRAICTNKVRESSFCTASSKSKGESTVKQIKFVQISISTQIVLNQKSK